MRTYSELLDMQVRGEDITPNPNNHITKKRKQAANYIVKEADGDKEKEYALSMSMLGDNVTRLQEFVLTHSEEPAPNLADLVKQVYQLRKNDEAEAADILDLGGSEAAIFQEQQEAQFEGDFGYVRDDFLGHLGAPLEIAVRNMQPNSLDPQLVAGIVNTVGQKLGSAELKRAAQGKSANFITGLSPGGKSHYNALLAYFKANPSVAQQVINGQLSDESQLPGWIAPSLQSGLYNSSLNNLAQPIINDQLKRAIPYLIGFLLLIGLIVFFASRSKK